MSDGLTELLYLTESYLKTTEAKVLDVIELKEETAIILDKTVFYPLGGGQPSDQGFIKWESGQAEIYNCLYKDGVVFHYTKSKILPTIGNSVTLEINWDRRYKNMCSHSGGHIVDFAMHLIGLTPKPLLPYKGDHGKKPYILYRGSVDINFRTLLQNKINEIVEKNLEFKTQFKSREEIEKTSIYVQSGLPSNKPLRVLILEGIGEVPDGGTQVAHTGDFEKVTVEDIVEENGDTIVYYSFVAKAGVQTTKMNQNPKIPNVENTKTSEITINQFETELLEAQSEIEATKDLKQLLEIKLKYLGASGVINKLTKTIKDEIKIADKKLKGEQINLLKNKILELLDTKQKEFEKSSEKFVDYSIPTNNIPLGSLHPTTHAIYAIEDILGKIGFIRKRHREIDNDYYPFEALNMPANHPARDEWETFFLENGKFVLTPHTSNGQVREMETHKKPPIKMLNIAKTYRRQISAKHSPMFHQFEGMYIDKNVSIAHLKGTLDYFVKAFFGESRETRIRPYHFKFTEPSFEVDVTCNKCDGKGCKICKEGWLEIGGAGMIHPNVLKNGGIDSKIYSGFAFGFGVERPYMMVGDINIPDIRYFYSTNLDFLKNF
ncbi:phenylalanine--tRNA ligase subunit alpha [Patescibacteria group bacterium]|nr:phenylalanine--tRNA ligase subunit alpha [Patescibacteria group bacterium]